MVKKLFLVLCVILIPLAGFSPKDKVIYIKKDMPIQPYEDLWLAVCKVESNGDPQAYNPEEKAIGISQIRLIRVKDYNRQTGKRYKHKEMYDPVKSKDVFMFFALKYPPSDIETAAKRWNGSGRKTEVYWAKVKKHLK